MFIIQLPPPPSHSAFASPLPFNLAICPVPFLGVAGHLFVQRAQQTNRKRERERERETREAVGQIRSVAQIYDGCAAIDFQGTNICTYIYSAWRDWLAALSGILAAIANLFTFRLDRLIRCIRPLAILTLPEEFV